MDTVKNVKRQFTGNSLVVQWLELGTFTAKGPASIPGWGTKVPQAMPHGQKNINKQKDNSQNGRQDMQIIYLIRDLHPKYIKNSTIKDK